MAIAQEMGRINASGDVIPLTEEELEDYVENVVKKPGKYLGDNEIRAFSELTDRPVFNLGRRLVRDSYQYYLNMYGGDRIGESDPICLFYADSGSFYARHYQALVKN